MSCTGYYCVGLVVFKVVGHKYVQILTQLAHSNFLVSGSIPHFGKRRWEYMHQEPTGLLNKLNLVQVDHFLYK